MKLSKTMMLPALGLLLCGSAAAVECVYKGASAETRVVSETGTMIEPKGWVSDGQCERLRVAVGPVQVVYRGGDGRVVRRDVTQGRLIARGEGAADSFLAEMRLMLAGDERARAGRSRSSAAAFDSVEAALPKGLVVLPAGPLELPLPFAADERGAGFRLSRGGATVYESKLAEPRLQIPVAVLRVGERYDWTIKTGTDNATGSFSVVDAATYRSALGAIEQADSTNPPGSIERKLATASSLLKQGYSVEARKLLREVLDQ